MMFNIINLIFTMFVLMTDSPQHVDPDLASKKLILSLTIAFLIFGIAYLLWQSFFVIPSE